MSISKYPVVSLLKDDEELLIEKTNALFMTVTPIEREVFFSYLKPIPCFNGIIKVNRNPQTYHIGIFGKYIVAHTQCKLGSIGRDSSQNVTSDSLADIQPNCTVMTGIAFGLKKKKKTMGDVLVSERIIPYEVARISKDSTDWRGESIRSGVTLLNRFENAIEWKYYGSRRKKSYKIHLGSVLSGEKLVDKIEFVKILETTFPKAVGGEMEGAGVSSVSDRKGKEWIVVKGICDWGEGKDKKNQKKAADTSTNLAYHVFSYPNGFEKFDLCNEEYFQNEDEPLSLEYDARRGSPLWALNMLRSCSLFHLIEDLKLHEKSGVDDEVCMAVKYDLQSVLEALGDIHKSLFNGKSLEEVVTVFFKEYSSWNDINGESIDKIEQRRQQILRLSKSRRRISKVVRSSNFLLGVGLTGI